MAKYRWQSSEKANSASTLTNIEIILNQCWHNIILYFTLQAYLCFLIHNGDLPGTNTKITPDCTPLGADGSHALLRQKKNKTVTDFKTCTTFEKSIIYILFSWEMCSVILVPTHHKLKKYPDFSLTLPTCKIFPTFTKFRDFSLTLNFLFCFSLTCPRPWQPCNGL